MKRVNSWVYHLTSHGLLAWRQRGRPNVSRWKGRIPGSVILFLSKSLCNIDYFFLVCFHCYILVCFTFSRGWGWGWGGSNYTKANQTHINLYTSASLFTVREVRVVHACNLTVPPFPKLYGIKIFFKHCNMFTWSRFKCRIVKQVSMQRTGQEESYLDHFGHSVRFLAEFGMQEPYELVNLSVPSGNMSTSYDWNSE